MKQDARHSLIESYLAQVEFATLRELAALTGASISTLRRDLKCLEEKGIIRRSYGGARLIHPKSDEFVFQVRKRRQLLEKTAIAKLVAQLIHPGQTVIIDGGTTAYYVALQLKPLHLQIITNSLPVAQLYSAETNAELVLTGGVLYPRLGVLLGPLAIESLRHMHADVAILGAGGVCPDVVTNSHVLVIDIQRAIMRAASRTILCVDHTKLGKRSLVYLCQTSQINVIVTDEKADPSVVEKLKEKGVEVHLAEIESTPTPPTPTTSATSD